MLIDSSLRRRSGCEVNINLIIRVRIWIIEPISPRWRNIGREKPNLSRDLKDILPRSCLWLFDCPANHETPTVLKLLAERMLILNTVPFNIHGLYLCQCPFINLILTFKRKPNHICQWRWIHLKIIDGKSPLCRLPIRLQRGNFRTTIQKWSQIVAFQHQ